MRMMSLLAAVLALGLTFGAGDADAAKRLGGGRSTGMQREMNVGQTPTPGAVPNAPTAAPSAPARSPLATAPAAAAQPKRSWLGPLAGLAAGLGLAALASHFGFGEGLASVMTVLLFVMLVVMVLGFILKRKAGHQATPAFAGGVPSGGFDHSSRGGVIDMERSASPSVSDMPTPRYAGSSIGTGIGAGVNASAAPVVLPIPADFDVAGFLRIAKTNFIRLQAANDAGNLDDLREVSTPEMFAEFKMDILERGAVGQQTEVVSIDAQVLEVVEENNRYIASVRFTGLMREEKGAAPEAFDEVWHLTKLRAGAGGWLLSGIQQAH